MIAIKEVGKKFQEYDTSSSVMVVLEGDKPLGLEAHAFYDQMVRDLRADTTHVQHVQDFWGDSLTAKGAQSRDGKAAYVQVYIAGDQGETLANDSVEAVRRIATESPAPDGVKAYVTGSAASSTDQNIVGDESMQMIELVTFGVIAVMLLGVYRSIITTLIVLVMVVLELSGARGLVALLGYHNFFGLTTFATNMLGDPGHRRGHRLRDIPDRPISGSQTLRPRQRSVLLRHVPRHGPCRARVGSDHRRRDVLPALHPAAVLPDHGHPTGDRNDRRGRHGADPGAGRHLGVQPVRQDPRAQAAFEVARMAPGRHRHRPLAGRNPGVRHRAQHWSACSPCPATTPPTTTASSCRRTLGRTSATTPRSGTSRRPR